MLKSLLKILSQPGPTLQAGFLLVCGEKELATDEHGKTRNQNISFRAGSVSDGWQSRRISHGRTRKNTESKHIIQSRKRKRRLATATARHSRVGGNPERYTLQRMDPRIREDDKSAAGGFKHPHIIMFRIHLVFQDASWGAASSMDWKRSRPSHDLGYQTDNLL